MNVGTWLLILVVLLSLGLMGCSIFLLLRANATSRPSSPIPNMTPTPSSDEMTTTSILKTVTEAMAAQSEATRQMVVDLVQGRVPPSNGRQATPPTNSVTPTTFDPDQNLLDPGIEAVLQRQADEQREETLLQERRVWQERFADLERRRREMTNEPSSLDGLDDRSSPFQNESPI